MAISGSQQAYRYALSGVARSGATRSGYTSSFVFISIGGVARRDKVAYESLSIDDELDETPNRCRFRLIDMTVSVGAPVVITLGSTNGARWFAGHVLTATEVLGGKPSQVRCDVACVDYTWQLGFKKVTKRYTTEAASDVVKDLVSTYAAADGFTTANVQAFGSLGELTFTNEDLTEAITRIARRLGAYWYVDYFKDVHLFTTETLNGDPEPLLVGHKSLAIEEFSYNADLSQTLTRVYVEGRGSRLLSSVNVGDTRLPLEVVDMFEVASDVFLKASFQGADGGAMHLNYAGVVTGGGGAIIGPGASPGGAPIVVGATVSGGAVTPGTHGYAFTYVTAAGESLPSVTASMVMGTLPNPAVPATVGAPDDTHLGELVEGGRYKIKYAYVSSGGAMTTLVSPESGWAIASAPTIYNGGSCRFYVPRSTDPAVVFIDVYRTTNNGSTFYNDSRHMHTAGTGNMELFAGTTIKDSNLPAQPGPPGANNFTQNTVNVSGIAAGPSGTTARKLYRTAAGQAQLKLLTTLADNTTTTYQDKLADASLGANVPVSDTSGLKQPEGQINPGATAIRVSSTAPFDAGGGWAVIGNGEQIIRYATVTADSLTGIPASGIGAITAVVVYNSTISQAPMLTGIPASGARSIGPRPLVAGDEIYLVVQCDDTARQTDLANRVGGTGIREEWLQDRRLSIPEARARGNATLQLRTLPQATLNYRCRDTRTAAGKTIWVDLREPINIQAPFRIQTVRIDNFRTHANQPPTFHVSASSSRFSFEDLLGRIKPRV